MAKIWKILLVEDDERIQRFLKDILNENFSNIEVFTAVNSDMAFQSHSEHPPDFITMDGKLGLDWGPEVVRRLRQAGCIATIVMFAGSQQAMEEGLVAGANAAFDKGLSFKDFLKYLKQHLG